MRDKPTHGQQVLLEYLQDEIKREGTTPSLRRAAADLGISHSAVAQTIRALEKKGYLRREGRYGRVLHLLNPARETTALQRWREIPIVGAITAGLPMYAQPEWDGSVVLDAAVYRGAHLFALRVAGDSMTGAGILNGDLAICEPRQYAHNGEIVVALIHHEEATIKRFFLHADHIELRPENPAYESLRHPFSDVLIQGKVVGIQRGPDAGRPRER